MVKYTSRMDLFGIEFLEQTKILKTPKKNQQPGFHKKIYKKTTWLYMIT